MGSAYAMQNSSNFFSCEYQKTSILVLWGHGQVGAGEVILLFLSSCFFQSWLLRSVSPRAQWLEINLWLIFSGKSFQWTGLFIPSFKLMKKYRGGACGSTGFRLLHIMRQGP